MRIVVIADVHSNVHALEAVLEAADAAAPDMLVCLGDLVGYNAHPRECVALLRERADVVVKGNHDLETVASTHTAGTNRDARTAGSWTRAQLEEDERHYLDGLPHRHVQEGAFVAVHGCYLNTTHVNGYVTSTMLPKNLEAVRDGAWPHVAFCGHTHTPLVGALQGGKLEESTLAEPFEWTANHDAVLLNPGAVGQPRDRDPRASMLVVDLDQRRAEVQRVRYDVQAATASIAAAGLPTDLADRLVEGR